MGPRVEVHMCVHDVVVLIPLKLKLQLVRLCMGANKNTALGHTTKENATKTPLPSVSVCVFGGGGAVRMCVVWWSFDAAETEFPHNNCTVDQH